MKQDLTGTAALIVIIVIIALCACQANSSPTPLRAHIQNLVMCDGASVALYAVPESIATANPITPEPLLTLSAATHCPHWSPHGPAAILATLVTTGLTDMRSPTTLQWFDAHTRRTEDFVTLSELDLAFVPVWQRDESRPRLALRSLRAADRSCLNQATILMAGVMCGGVHAEAFLMEPEGQVTQLTKMTEPLCKVLPSPNGLWLAVTNGICGGLRQHLSLVRLDTGETLDVPIDLSVHGLDDIAWQPNSAAIAITVRRQTRSSTKSKGSARQFNDVLLYTLADQKLALLMNGLVQLQFLSWLKTEPNALLYVEAGVIWQQHVSDARPQFIARIAALAQPAIKACSPTFSLSQDNYLLAWQESCDGSAAHTGWLNLRTGVFGAYDAMRQYKGVIKLSPDAAWIASITAERAQGAMLSRATLINTQTRQTIDLGICPPGTRLDWLITPSPKRGVPDFRFELRTYANDANQALPQPLP